MLTQNSAFTSENVKVDISTMWDILKPLPAQVKQRNEVPRKAYIYLLSQIPQLHLDTVIVREIAQGKGLEAGPNLRFELPSRGTSQSACELFMTI